MSTSIFTIALLAAWVLTTAASRIDRRVVDLVNAGDPESEATHGYAGHDAFTAVAGGKPYRQARGWMRYALTTFDDTDVTVAFDFIAVDSVPRRYDVVVEDSLIATRTFSAGAPVVVELAVPFAITKGKSNIAITVRARGGLTPALHALRTIQDHNEVDHAGAHGTLPAPSPSPRPQQLPGALR